MVSKNHGTSLTFAAGIVFNAKCAVEIAAMVTLKLVKLKETTTGESGEPMMKLLALLKTWVAETLKDLQMSVFAAWIKLFDDKLLFISNSNSF